MKPDHFPPYASELQSLLLRTDESLSNLLSLNPSLVVEIVRAVLHTVRRQLKFEQSLCFLNKLPLPLKALYIDHWDTQESATQLETLEDLMDEIEKEYPYLMRDIQHDRQLVRQTFLTVGKLTDYPIDLPMSKLSDFSNQENASGVESQPFQIREYETTESSIWLS